MRLPVDIEPAARQDLAELFLYIGTDNLDAAFRFYDAADAAFVRLSEMPGIGTLIEHKSRRLKGLRRWPVPGFPNYLIFYRTTPDEVHIIRILHGARDIAALLDRDLQD